MENDNEVVIKIEYFDTDETDPLKEPKDINYEELKCEEIKGYNRNSESEDNDWTVQNCSKDVDLQNGVGPKKPSWYENIDKSGKYICKFCSLTYLTVQTLRRHILKKHAAEGKKLKNEIGKNKRGSKIKCHICTSNFKALSDLKEHMQVHNDGDSKSYCHVCQAKFDGDVEMAAHLLAEHKIQYSKMCICNVCGYRTSKLSHFKQHQSTHSDQKSNKCEFCDYATNSLPNLKIHERTHTNYKPYECSFTGCEYRGVTRSALRSHLLKHTPDKNMLYCAKCPYKTVYRQSLQKHNESHIRNTAKIFS